MRGTGLDLGTRVATSAVVSTGLKGTKLESLRSVAVPETGEARREALRGLRHGSLPSAIAVPVHAVSSRVVTLPFSQPVKWDAVLPSELEGQIPFEVDDVVIDGTLIGRDGDRTRVLAAALPKSALRATLEEVASGGIDPRVVTVDAEALAAAATAWLPRHPDLALFHLDDRAVTMVLLSDGRVRAARGVLWSGPSVREPFDPAGPSGASLDLLVGALKPALDDLARTLRADRLESGRTVALGAVSGRWSDLPGLSEHVTRVLGLERVAWPVLALGGAERSLAPGAAAAGLALIAARDGGRINFRRGEFAFGQERAGLRRRLVALGAVAAFVLVAAGIDGGLRLSVKERRLAEVDGRVKAAFHEVLPGATIVSEPEQLQAAIDTAAKRRAFLGSRIGMLDVLLALTDAVPKESEIAVSDLSVDEDKVRIEAETRSFDWVNRIEAAVGRSPLVSSVTVSDAKTTADQSKVRFLMTIVLKEGV